MNRRWWEGSVCFICDYWYVILLILLLLLTLGLTYRLWLPLLGVNPPITPAATSNAPIAQTSTNQEISNITWETFNGSGYQLQYPSNWYIFQEPQGSISQDLPRYDLILSNVPNSSPQDTLPGEEVRVTVIYAAKESGQSLEKWATVGWTWLDSELSFTTLNGVRALTITNSGIDISTGTKFYWLEFTDYYLAIIMYLAPGNPNSQNILQSVSDSITF